MLTRATVILAVMIQCAWAEADYLAERKAALETAKAGNSEEAIAMFVKTAESPYTDVQKADALEQAALIAQRLKQYDRAMQLAQRIPLAPASRQLQMSILKERRDWPGLAGTYKNEDLASWPEWFAAEAFLLRGEAFLRTGDGTRAEADLVQAVTLQSEQRKKAWAFHLLGETAVSLLKDDAKALDAYRQAKLAINAEGWLGYEATLGAARALQRLNRQEEALAECDDEQR